MQAGLFAVWLVGRIHAVADFLPPGLACTHMNMFKQLQKYHLSCYLSSICDEAVVMYHILSTVVSTFTVPYYDSQGEKNGWTAFNLLVVNHSLMVA